MHMHNTLHVLNILWNIIYNEHWMVEAQWMINCHCNYIIYIYISNEYSGPKNPETHPLLEFSHFLQALGTNQMSTQLPSLKLTASSHLKHWHCFRWSFTFGKFSAYFQGAMPLAVSFGGFRWARDVCCITKLRSPFTRSWTMDEWPWLASPVFGLPSWWPRRWSGELSYQNPGKQSLSRS